MDASDLERANTFSLDRAQSFTDYKPMEDQVVAEEEIIDEEHVHWKVLLTRVFCFFLLFLVILFCALVGVNRRFVFLAAFICIFLVFVIIATYVDIPARLRSWWVILTGRPLYPPNNANNNSSVDGAHSRGPSLPLGSPPAATVINPLSANR